jgi:hypothetical protein
VTALFVDAAGNVWVSNDTRVLHPDGTWTNYALPSSALTGDSMTAFAEDEHGRVWIGTRMGVSVWSPDGTWTNFIAAKSGLLDNWVQALLIDPQGNTWIGTDGGLSQRAPDGSWTNFGTPDAVQELAWDRTGRIWVVSGRYLGYLGYYDSSGHWHEFKVSNSDPSGPRCTDVHDVAFDQAGQLWIGTNGGVISVAAPASTQALKPPPLRTILVLRSMLEWASLVLLGLLFVAWATQRALWHSFPLDPRGRLRSSLVWLGASVVAGTTAVAIARPANEYGFCAIPGDNVPAAALLAMNALTSSFLGGLLIAVPAWMALSRSGQRLQSKLLALLVSGVAMVVFRELGPIDDWSSLPQAINWTILYGVVTGAIVGLLQGVLLARHAPHRLRVLLAWASATAAAWLLIGAIDVANPIDAEALLSNLPMTVAASSLMAVLLGGASAAWPAASRSA